MVYSQKKAYVGSTQSSVLHLGWKSKKKSAQSPWENENFLYDFILGLARSLLKWMGPDPGLQWVSLYIE